MDQGETLTTSIDRRAGEWVHGRSSEHLLSCSRGLSVWSFLFCAGGSEQSFVYYGGGGLQPKTPVGADNVDSSMSIW